MVQPPQTAPFVRSRDLCLFFRSQGFIFCFCFVFLDYVGGLFSFTHEKENQEQFVVVVVVVVVVVDEFFFNRCSTNLNQNIILRMYILQIREKDNE